MLYFINRKIKKTANVLAVGMLLVSANLFAQPTKVHYPQKHWEVAESPESLGFSSEKLKAVSQYAEQINTAAIMVVVDGKVAYQWGEIDKKYNTHSMRKSFLSAMYGKYVREGLIDLDVTMADLKIDDNEGLSKEEKKATVRDLLKARSGVYHPALYETKGMRNKKPARYSVKPGTFWYYNNWDFNVLGTIFEKKTGKGIFKALEADIAEPIGMEDFKSSDGQYITGKASIHRAYPFRITARDVARFGWLMLNNGRWEDQQVIDSAWVAESTRYHSDATLYGTSGYGYMWWVARDYNKYPHFKKNHLPEGTYSARGAGGHYLVIIPAYNMVVVHRVNTDIRDNKVLGSEFGELLKRIIESKL